MNKGIFGADVDICRHPNKEGKLVTPCIVTDNGDLVDLRAAESYDIKAGDFVIISLGITVKFPEGFWGFLAPRSSLFKKTGLIVANSVGVIEQCYCGPNDIWGLAVYATRDTHIDFDQRIAQFTLIPKVSMKLNDVEEVSQSESRGGFGSTGDKQMKNVICKCKGQEDAVSCCINFTRLLTKHNINIDAIDHNRITTNNFDILFTDSDTVKSFEDTNKKFYMTIPYNENLISPEGVGAEESTLIALVKKIVAEYIRNTELRNNVNS